MGSDLPVLARRTPAAALLGVLALLYAGAPATAQAPVTDADLSVAFAETPRLVRTVPLAVRTTGPGTLTAAGEVRVGGRRIVEIPPVTGRRPRSGERFGLFLRQSLRRRVDRAATAARREPEIVVTVTAAIDGRPGVATRTVRRQLRRAPFYDASIVAPDAPRSETRGFAIAFDLPFSFDQVVGAMAGTPAVGRFRKYVRAREGGPACAVTLDAHATTARTAPQDPRTPLVARGRKGPWRFLRGTTDAVVIARAPAALPGTRPWLVVRYTATLVGAQEACAGEERRTVDAVLRRVVRTTTVRAAAPQPGPGTATA